MKLLNILLIANLFGVGLASPPNADGSVLTSKSNNDNIKGHTSVESKNVTASEVTDTNGIDIDPKEDRIIFGMMFDYHDQVLDQKHSLNIRFQENGDPYALADYIRTEYNLDLLTYRWLLRSFQHGVARLNEPEVATLAVDVQVSSDAGNGKETARDLPPICVRYGDDLAMLARMYAHEQGLGINVSNVILEMLLAAVPQHSEQAWVQRRRSHSKQKAQGQHSPTTKRNREMDFTVVQREKYSSTSKCELSIALIPTGDINIFYDFVDQFPTTNLLCEVIVVDDTFSPMDRAKLMNDFAHFSFVFVPKIEGTTGSAGPGNKSQILNIITKLAKSRYLLLMADSWRPTLLHTDEHLRNALTLLKANGYHNDLIAQVALNDQSSLACSFGYEAASNVSSLCHGLGGWKRVLNVNEQEIHYVENEFGSMYHGQAYSSQWPGFSFLPAIWDLNVLHANVDLTFDELETSFDATFALQIWDAGLTTVHLPTVNYKFLGSTE